MGGVGTGGCRAMVCIKQNVLFIVFTSHINFHNFPKLHPVSKELIKLFASPPPFVFIFPWRHINVRGSML